LINRLIVLHSLAFGIQLNTYADGTQPPYKFDWSSPNIELHSVHVQGNDMGSAYKEMGSKYLLRVNLYLGGLSDADSVKFTFDKDVATERELLEAFVATYTAYTYTEDTSTGVIWIHPKRLKYDNILGEKVRIVHPACQVPVFDGVIKPLCALFSTPYLHEGSGSRQTFNYGFFTVHNG